MRRALIVAALALTACQSVPAPASRLRAASNIAAAAGWQARPITVAGQQFLAFGPPAASASIDPHTLDIYLEGDGLAYLSPTDISDDPTPLNPVALRLAVQDPRPAVYLARPCQYMAAQAACTPAVWTSERFSPASLALIDQAVSQLKTYYGATQLRLIGYSGGGALMTLLAAQRNDVVGLITVAANLDMAAWTHDLGLAALPHALNPADQAARISALPQRHFIGAEDAVVPPSVGLAFARHFAADAQPDLQVLPGFDHSCCWLRDWPRLLAAPLQAPGRVTGLP